MSRHSPLPLAAVAALGFILLLAAVAWLFAARTGRWPGTAASTPTTRAVATPTDVWRALLQMTPVAYATPLPEPVPGPLDGTYAQLDPSPPQWWKCLRCADYRPAGGIWRLQFDRGVMRLYYAVTGWRSLASFSVSGDRLFLFNDPYCPDDVGEYSWKVEDGQLRLEVIADACAFDLRAANLSRQPWSACPTSADSVGADGLPVGCETEQTSPVFETGEVCPVAVAVHGGDSRFFEVPPDVIVIANGGKIAPPEGIRVTFHADSIAYGVHRVLWWEGDWIEVTTDRPFASMGVQFLGEPQIGWARVLFDGVEVWRGNTSEIWSGRGRHGGYIEISGFGPGRHTLRAESLGGDYRPVTVAGFGFSREGGVVSGSP